MLPAFFCGSWHEIFGVAGLKIRVDRRPFAVLRVFCCVSSIFRLSDAIFRVFWVLPAFSWRILFPEAGKIALECGDNRRAAPLCLNADNESSRRRHQENGKLRFAYLPETKRRRLPAFAGSLPPHSRGSLFRIKPHFQPFFDAFLPFFPIFDPHTPKKCSKMWKKRPLRSQIGTRKKTSLQAAKSDAVPVSIESNRPAFAIRLRRGPPAFVLFVIFCSKCDPATVEIGKRSSNEHKNPYIPHENVGSSRFSRFLAGFSRFLIVFAIFARFFAKKAAQ